MWIVGFRNLPYVGQDTNAAIESYHGYMKSILKAERSRMVGRRVDWCIHALTRDVVTHYSYYVLQKIHGFVDNKKERGIVVSALIQARDIPDTDVTLLVSKGGLAFVTSTTHRHIHHAIHNSSKFWATCTCVHSLCGNICKHQVKVLRLMHPDLAEGTIAKFYGVLVETISAGFPCPSSPPAEETVPKDCPPISAPEYLMECVVDLETTLES